MKYKIWLKLIDWIKQNFTRRVGPLFAQHFWLLFWAKEGVFCDFVDGVWAFCLWSMCIRAQSRIHSQGWHQKKPCNVTKIVSLITTRELEGRPWLEDSCCCWCNLLTVLMEGDSVIFFVNAECWMVRADPVGSPEVTPLFSSWLCGLPSWFSSSMLLFQCDLVSVEVWLVSRLSCSFIFQSNLSTDLVLPLSQIMLPKVCLKNGLFVLAW